MKNDIIIPVPYKVSLLSNSILPPIGGERPDSGTSTTHRGIGRSASPATAAATALTNGILAKLVNSHPFYARGAAVPTPDLPVGTTRVYNSAGDTEQIIGGAGGLDYYGKPLHDTYFNEESVCNSNMSFVSR